ncbi:MAG TPA: hypothetical protein VJ783_08010, partial [Pirellulales bacterium]|nr:hypothetical protein [Pirellulales bacterium]
MSPLRTFLMSLVEHGRVEVAAVGEALEARTGEADELLLGCDELSRAQLAFTAPPYHPAVARWAAELIDRGCQALVYRQLDAGAVRQSLSVDCPAPIDGGVLYSADLMLRYLPDLLILARGMAEHDVLVDELLRLAAAWPLSSVGVQPLGPEQLDRQSLEIIVADACLRQLYVDRVIARRDAARLAHPAVAEGVRQS